MVHNPVSVLIDEDGATLLEYCLLVGFIAAVSIAVLTLFGTKVSNLFAPIAPAL